MFQNNCLLSLIIIIFLFVERKSKERRKHFAEGVYDDVDMVGSMVCWHNNFHRIVLQMEFSFAIFSKGFFFRLGLRVLHVYDKKFFF